MHATVHKGASILANVSSTAAVDLAPAERRREIKLATCMRCSACGSSWSQAAGALGVNVHRVSYGALSADLSNLVQFPAAERVREGAEEIPSY